MEERDLLLGRLDDSVRRVCALFQGMPQEGAGAPGEWGAREVLAHLTFWHESFARNVRDCAAGRKPTPLQGTLAALNRRSVDEVRDCTAAALVQRLADAQAVIRANILAPRLTLIPYRRGARDYSPEEHLEIVERHIRQHLKQLQRRGDGG